MIDEWDSTEFQDLVHAGEILESLHRRSWLCRGQPRDFGGIVPSLQRGARSSLSRVELLTLERKSIETFQSTCRVSATQGERRALEDPITGLLVLRHYGVPTRILDWSLSPWVAAYFATEDVDSHDGEIWAFDRPYYEEVGREQWKRWPETTTDGSGDPDKFAAGLTAFLAEDPPNWFICVFYPPGFPRQDAQNGAYTMMARFGQPHDRAIQELLRDKSRCHRYIVPAVLKSPIRERLDADYGIWRGSLFPDSAGAADTVRQVVFSGMR